MSNKRENELARKDGLTHSSEAIRRSFNAEEESLDVISHGCSLVPKKYTRLETTVTSGLISSIDFYDDNVMQVSEVTLPADVSQSLAGTYWTFYTGLDRVKYYVWYSVDGNGSDPGVASATGIEVALQENDLAAVNALATKNAINTNAEFYFRVQNAGNNITIYNKQGGVTTATADGDAGISVRTITSGSSEQVASIDITYNGDNVSTIKRY